MEVKKTLHDSVVIRTLTYGSEAWTMTERHRSRVRGVEMSYLRSSCGVTWRDKLTNEEVRERCNVDVDVLESVKRNNLRWFGHIERIGSERLVKKVYESEVEGWRGRGRPRTRWKDGPSPSPGVRRQEGSWANSTEKFTSWSEPERGAPTMYSTLPEGQNGIDAQTFRALVKFFCIFAVDSERPIERRES
ncbi:hypothetical protein Pmani_004513 [Petrolisthes manimaculis]|uniref:Uncharacterized protein n=1 Tax=Petrolisthes manimaculis TaxID=1843537 RepID=A0AAE1QEG6_9EUCA|nr:hypothetical protein Pmani_004513 [Petrolisthes manimaculis]